MARNRSPLGEAVFLAGLEGDFTDLGILAYRIKRNLKRKLCLKVNSNAVWMVVQSSRPLGIL